MAGEGPPFLTVGTDVSAKYRGAFCEAKVKVVKKLVKCKINFKNGTNCMVSDDFVKGTLKVGAKVEAKMTENGPFEEGTIMKLNDASLYTVVFDDGDEKTLRRTLLCLQGEKHFHESETLDHLPLTDPENFGTPVMRDSKNMRRKRRMSNRSQSDDDDEEDDESDSDAPKKQRKEEPEDAVGKVVIVEMNEKRKTVSFPALVVDPSCCTKDMQPKGKDQILVRSFKDNKFYTVAKSSRKPFVTKDHTYKGDVASLKTATEKAVTFIDTGQLPPNWDFDMLKKKRSNKQGTVESSDDTSEDSSDDEYDMEKDAWLASLHKFMEERGTPINKPPVLGFRDLNLYKLYKLVQDHGGCRKVTDKQLWRHIMTKMGIPASATPQPYNIHTSYNKYLFAFEEFNRKMGPSPRIFTRMRRRSFDRGWMSPPVISRQRSQVKPEVKDEPSDKDEEEESPSKKRVTRKKGEESGKQQEAEENKRETRETKARVKDQEKEDKDTSERDEKKVTKKSSKDDKTKTKEQETKEQEKEEKDMSDKEEKKGNKKASKDDKNKDKSKGNMVKEKASEEKSNEKVKEKPKDAKGKDRTEEKLAEKLAETAGKEKGKEFKAKEKKKGRIDSAKDDETGGIQFDAGYEIGEKVLVHYGRGRTEKIYEAKVVDIELKGKDPVFTVHYTGWNNRYDEAVKKSRIVGSAEKKKKKLTPKGKAEKEKSKKDLERREKEEQQRKEKEEAEKREEENRKRALQERELKEKQEKERLEKEKAEKERQEKERREKQEKERKEKEKKEKERLEKERKEKERKEKERLEKEQREKLEKERLEQEKKEKQEREKREQEKERREKQDRDKKEKERLEQESREREEAEKAKEAEKELKEKEKAGKDGKKTPTGKRGRPSLNKSSPAPQTPPRSLSTSRGKSPSPASVFSQRSMRSDRKSLTESPFAGGLNVRSRSKRSSTGEYRRGTQEDSESEMDETDVQSESQQSTQDSEDSQMKDSRLRDQELAEESESSKTEDYAATLTKVGEEKPSFHEDIDEGPPTLTAEVEPQVSENRQQEADSDAPKVEEVDKSAGEKEGRSRSKKESKFRLRKSVDRERDNSREPESLKLEKDDGKNSPKDGAEKEDFKEKMDETPILERQLPTEAELKEKLEELKQESKDSASDADKPVEKKKGRRKGRKSIESRKRKTEAEAEISEKSETSETSEPKKKHAKIDRRKSDKGGKKSKEQESKTPADNTDSDFGTSSVDEKSLPGTSKSFMTTPPTTPESSPKMPSSPSRDEDIQVKSEEQNSNKSDSDALIEVANIDEKDVSQVGSNTSALNSSLSSSVPKKNTAASASHQPSPKKRRRGASESEPGKKRKKHSRRRRSSISERRHSAKERGNNNNSSDTDESRSESRLTSSSSKHKVALKNFSGNLPSSRVSDDSGQQGSQRQRRWNFLVDLSNVKEPDERIAIIQHQLSELRSVYMQLKQEVATIDRRRKKFRKKEREAAQVMAGVALGHCLSQGGEKTDSGGS